MSARLQTHVTRSVLRARHLEPTDAARLAVPLPIGVALATGEERLPLLDLTVEGFSLQSARPFEDDAIVHLRFTLSSCLSLVLPARVQHGYRTKGHTHRRPYVTLFQFAMDQGTEDLERIVALLVEAATMRETVH